METTQKPRQERPSRPADAGTKQPENRTPRQPETRREASRTASPAQRETHRREEPRRQKPSDETPRERKPQTQERQSRQAPRQPRQERPQTPETARPENPERTTREARQRAPRTEERRESRPAARREAPADETRPSRPAARTEEAREPRRAPAKEWERREPDTRRRRAAEAKPARKPARKRPEDLDPIPNKRRTYGSSKPKKEPAISRLAKNVSSALKKLTEKRKRKSGHQGQPTPAVIYTEPAAFSRNRLVVQLVTVIAVVLALTVGLSVFFKVQHIYVSGAKVYSESAITEVCGISKGDNLLTFSHARAAALIQANRPYVREVRFGIKLPDTVNIIIEEDEVVYAVKDDTGQWWLMNSSGRVVTQGTSATVANKTQILGVNLDNPTPNEHAVAMESAPAVTDTTDPTGETVTQITPVTTTGAQRLDAALEILKALEANDIVGSAASVDVSRIDDIVLWYGTRYQVNLGDSTRLEYKIACMNSVIAQMSEYQSGVLDCSFTIWEKQVGYTPFS